MQHSLAELRENSRPSREPSHPASAALTAKIESGDEAAFAQFYEAWFDRTFSLARSITRRDESFCLDVVQDTMMRVVRSIRAIGSESGVEAWMARAVVTTSVDRLRSERRRAKREQRAARSERDPTADPLDDAAQAEQLSWLRDRIDELPPRDRKMLAARFDQDQTLEATGAAIGLSGNAAHGRLRRIVHRLRERARGLFHD